MRMGGGKLVRIDSRAYHTPLTDDLRLHWLASWKAIRDRSKARASPHNHSRSHSPGEAPFASPPAPRAPLPSREPTPGSRQRPQQLRGIASGFGNYNWLTCGTLFWPTLTN